MEAATLGGGQAPVEQLVEIIVQRPPLKAQLILPKVRNTYPSLASYTIEVYALAKGPELVVMFVQTPPWNFQVSPKFLGVCEVSAAPPKRTT
jgi:hypothetical protein